MTIFRPCFTISLTKEGYIFNGNQIFKDQIVYFLMSVKLFLCTFLWICFVYIFVVLVDVPMTIAAETMVPTIAMPVTIAAARWYRRQRISLLSAAIAIGTSTANPQK
ncbi:hypothetical protein BC833DRAFT_563347, partial [Globomyces pollinis-pini]